MSAGPELVAEWMDAARAGDRAAFGLLYVHYRDKVYRFIRHRVHRHEIAEELTADTFVRALRSIDRFTWQGRDPGAWLFTIARNIAVDYVRAATARPEQLTPDYAGAAAEHRLRDDDADPAQHVVDAEDERARLWRIHEFRMEILRLPTEDQQAAMLYRHVDGLSIGETAARMGRPATAVKALCFRGTAHLASSHLATLNEVA